MKQASMREACATPGREKARELQLPGPSQFSTPTPANSAGCPTRQDANTDCAAFGADGSRLISNVGQLRKAVRGVHNLVWHRHGRAGPPAADAANYYFMVAVIEEAAARIDPTFGRDLKGWTSRNLRRLAPAARAEIDADLNGRLIEVTQKWLGEQPGLLDAERDAIRFFDALPIDMTAEQRAAKARARDAQRKRDEREACGATPRARCRARQREQHPTVPAATFYRQNPASPRAS